MSTTIARNAGLKDFVELLRDRQARKADAVVPAAAIHSQDGVLRIDGAVEASLSATGVSAAQTAWLRPTELADGQIADKLGIPTAYLRKLRCEHVALYDANVNGWLDQEPRRTFLVRGLVDGPDTVPDSPAALEGCSGVLRSLLSDSYRPIEDLDVVMASLDGIRRSGQRVEVTGCDLTEARMYLKIACPAVSTLAPALLSRYVSPFTGHRGADNPLVFAGFVIANSETGSGRYKLTPQITVQVCTNGMTLSKEAISEVHLGGKLEAGPVRWSSATTKAATDLITTKTVDAVNGFLSPEFLARQVAAIEAEAGTPITDVTATVQHVTSTLHYSKAQADAILADFISGADRTAGGVLHAVTSTAQRQDDADVAHGMEADGLRAMTLAAAHQQ